MANHMNEYINPLYSALASPDVLVPNIAPQNIKFWRGMYCRFESGVHPREPLGDLLLATCDHSSSLEDHIRLLTKVNLIYFAVTQLYCVKTYCIRLFYFITETFLCKSKLINPQLILVCFFKPFVFLL